MSITLRFTYKCDVCQRQYFSEWIKTDEDYFDVSGHNYRPEGWRYVSEVGDVCPLHQIDIKPKEAQSGESSQAR